MYGARHSMFAITALAVTALSGCGVVPSLGGSGGDAGASSGSTTGASAGAGGDAGAKGVDCIQESTTGATLCTGLATCPGLMVDHDVYPDCGFRPNGTLVDLECACQGSLCPIGVAQTCEQAKKLLSEQSETTVCAQLAESRCTAGVATPASTGAPKSSTCDKQCAAECGGAPGCLGMCGC